MLHTSKSSTTVCIEKKSVISEKNRPVLGIKKYLDHEIWQEGRIFHAKIMYILIFSLPAELTFI